MTAPQWKDASQEQWDRINFNVRPERYPPAGRCIYCGDTEAKLTDEHIIPAAIAGPLILPEASCPVCQKIINEEFEQFCLREMFGLFRYKVGMQSTDKKRKKRNRPIPSMQIKKHKDSNFERVEHKSRDEYPLGLVMFSWPPPLILEGRKSTGWTVRDMHFFADLVEYQRINDFQSVLSPLVGPGDLQRLLAKIAHAYVSAVYPGDFRPLLLDIILGRQEEHGCELIGGQLECAEPTDRIHEISIRTQFATTGRRFLIVDIRLFSFLRTPQYHVVVGELPSIFAN